MAFLSSSSTAARDKAAELLRGHCTLLAFWALKHAGVLAAMVDPKNKQGIDPAEYAASSSMSADTLLALLNYLDHQGIVTLKGDQCTLTALGVALDSDQHPILELLRAHQPVLNSLEHLLAKLKSYGGNVHRRSDTYAKAQNLRYAEELYPTLEKAAGKIPVTHVLDLGCGPGALLLHLAKALPKTVGIAACDDGALTRAANTALQSAGLDQRFFAFTASPFELCTDTKRTFERLGISKQLWGKIDCLLAVNLFSDHAAADEKALITHLSGLGFAFPKATLLVAEPCLGPRLSKQPHWPELELLTHLTQTRFHTATQWKQILTLAGYVVSAMTVIDTDNMHLFVCHPKGLA